MLNNIIGALVVSIVNILVCSKLLNEKINYKKHKVYIAILIMSIVLIINFFTVNHLLRMLTTLFLVGAMVMYVYSVDLKKAMTASLINQLAYILCELAVIIIISLIVNKSELINAFFGSIYANLVIAGSVLAVSCLDVMKKLYAKMLQFFSNQKIFYMLIVLFTLLEIISIFLNFIYYNDNFLLLLVSFLILIVLYSYFMIKTVIIKNNYLNMYVKYNTTLETLKSYEDILDKYKVSNHENKNQLLMIRNMLGKDTNGEVGVYIDNIVKNEYEDDENLIMETVKIPSGGLRALIYSKLLYMKNNNIDFNLKVDRKLRHVGFADFQQNLILDVCKIIGVFLDNSIEEVKKSSQGSIRVELYMMDKKLNISVANTFEGFIDLDRIDELKYTTKGDGHGYGLTLVREIISKNEKLQNVRMINDNIFIQILKVTI